MLHLQYELPCLAVRDDAAEHDKIGGAVDLVMSPVSASVVVTSSLLSRHHVWHGTDVSPRQENMRGQKCWF